MKIVYFVAVRIMGGEWTTVQKDGSTQEFQRLEDALGLAATHRSAIKETLVGSIEKQFVQTENGLAIAAIYDCVEYQKAL